MAEEIGKLAVSLSMDDDGFNNSISGINRSLKVLGSELGALRSQGSEFGNSVEGLAQRQDALGRTLTVQEQKVNQLRAAYERSAAETGQYSTKSQQLAAQLNKAVGEMNRTKNELNQVGTALSQQQADAAKAESAWTKFSNAMDKASQKLQDAGQKMKDLGGNMTAGVTAPLLGLGAGAIKAADDMDSANGRIQAQLGLTAEESERVGDVAETLWKDAFTGSMEEAADGVANVVKNMKEISPDELESVAEQALTVADVFGQDINDVTKTADQLMQNFGLTSTEAFDLMTAGFQNGLDYSGEMLDTLNEYSPQFAALGFSGEEFFSTLAAGAEAGAFNLDKVGDAVKEFNIRAKDGSDASAEAFEALGMNAEEMTATFAKGGPEAQKSFQQVVQELSKIEDPVKRNQVGVALFGTQFEDLEADVIAAMGTTKSEFSDVAGKTDEAGQAMYDNFGTRLTSVFRELQTALLPLGEVLLEWAEAILPKITSAAQKMAEWFGKMSPVGQTLTVVFGAIAAALGPLFVILGTVIGAIGNMIPVIMKILPYLSKMKTVFTVIRTVMLALTGPVGIIIAIVTALAIVIYKNWDTIKAKTIELMSTLKSYFSTGWTAIVSYTSQLIATLKSYFVTGWTAITSTVSQLMSTLKSYFSTGWAAIKSVTSSLISVLVSFIKNLWSGLVAYFKFIVNVYRTIFSTGFNFIKNTVSNLANGAKNVAVSAFNALRSALSNVISGIRNVVSTGFNFVKSTISNLANGAKNVAVSAFNALRSALSNVISGIRNVVSTGFNFVRTTVSNLTNGARNAAVSAFNALRSGASTAINGVRSVVSTVFSGIRNLIVNPIQSAKNTVLGIIDAIKGAFSRMNITIPKPKLPRVSVSMGSKEIGGVSIPFPKFDVSWFAKGGIIDGASVVGVGEAGPEAIVPLQGANMRPFAEAIAAAMPSGSGGGLVTVEVPIYLDGYQIAKASQPYIDLNQQSKTQQKSYMKGVK